MLLTESEWNSAIRFLTEAGHITDDRRQEFILHFMVTAPGFRTLVTHIFVRGDELLTHDSVFGVKESLIMDFLTHPSNEPTPDGRHIDGGTWSSTRFDIVLAPGVH